VYQSVRWHKDDLQLDNLQFTIGFTIGQFTIYKLRIKTDIACKGTAFFAHTQEEGQKNRPGGRFLWLMADW
jgi:hypothetical protein